MGGLVVRPMVASAAGALAWEDTGPKTELVGGTLYASAGAGLRLKVTADAKCAEVDYPTDGGTAKVSKAGQSSWTIDFAAPNAPAGPKSVAVRTYKASNPQGCTGPVDERLTQQYVLDIVGPDVKGSLAPAPNAAGWTARDTTITWTATDVGGSGIGSGPTPGSDPVTTDGVVNKTATATDKVGNSSVGTVAVKLDKTAPTIKSARSPAANANGWNNTPVNVTFACDDGPGSGIVACSGGTTVTANGPNQSVLGTATDTAGNVTTNRVADINVDTEHPTVTGSLGESPNGAGWFNKNVPVSWSVADAVSGVDPATAPRSDDVIAGEGAGLFAAARVFDRAGNAGVGHSPPVNIDRTAPTTAVDAPGGWNNVAVDIVLKPQDNLSGVAATHFAVDGGAEQRGTTVRVGDEGEHSVKFWSVDVAGNAESPRTITVKIDRTPPVIRALLAPLPTLFGWRNADVTITYECSSGGGAPLAECSGPETVAVEGRDLARSGRAVDAAGNVAHAPVSVSIDKSKPTIEASASRQPNPAGWYREPVTVMFSCADGLSGIADCPAPRVVESGVVESVGGTAVDKAGNSSSTAMGPVRVDTTEPTITGSVATTGASPAGWYRTDVAVRWTCGDDLSGLAGACPAPSTVTGEGESLAAAAKVTDLAGNSGGGLVGGIRIDRTPPRTTASVPAARENGWYRDAVTVELSAADNLSGVAQTYYRIDGGDAQLYDGSFTVRENGRHTVRFWSTDAAGNTEEPGPANQIVVAVDGVAPTVKATRTPVANRHGWNNGPVSVLFDCSDGESGVAGACPAQSDLRAEGAGQSASGSVTDQAGNVGSGFVSDVNIDLTPPTITGRPRTAPNASGWHNGDVLVDWDVADALSGPDPDTPVAPSTVTGEGDALTAGPVEGRDRAGNAGTGQLGGLRIDRTPPRVTAEVIDAEGKPRLPNRNGWYDSAARVRFRCEDPLSGVASCTDDRIVPDGVWESITGSGVDKAGNGGEIRLPPINVDSVPPVTTAALDCGGGTTFCRGGTAIVRLSSGQVGFAGVEEIRVAIDRGEERSFPGPSALVEVPLPQATGQAELLFFAVDTAGNREEPKRVVVRFDNIAPVVTAQVTPEPNAAGWNNRDVTVRFEAVDDEGGSGVASITPDQTVTKEGASQRIDGEATDTAGNVGRQSAIVSLDKTPPTATAAATAPPTETGWYRGPVTVAFTCRDDLSGVATCPSERTLATDGAGQSVTGTAVDTAGNVAEATAAQLHIDATPPSTTASVPPPLETGWYAGPVPVTLGALDAVSGVAEIRYRVDNEEKWTRYDGPISFDRPGSHTVRFWAVDVAGNVEPDQGADNAIVLKIDNRPPIIELASRTARTPQGWNNTPVVLTFSCSDAESSVAACPPALTVDTPGGGQSVSVEAVDLAGNRSPLTVGGINIDLTPPRLVPTTSALNAAGWARGDVEVTWTAEDGLSGIDGTSMPKATTLRDEGRDQIVSGTVRDNAGNSTTVSADPVSIDRTPPAVTPRPTTKPNEAGWYKAPVTVEFDCADPLSGISACQRAVTLGENGPDQRATGRAVDVAGNAAEQTAGGINIDRDPPSTRITAPCTTDRPCAGDSTMVRLTASDQAGLSGVSTINYRIEGAEQGALKGDGGEVRVPLPKDRSGSTTVTYWAVDRAGNEEMHNVTQISFDNVAPVVTHAVTPPPNAAGWASSAVTVDFSATDDGGSIAREPDDVRVDEEVDSKLVTGTAHDNAGNVGTDTVLVKIDLTDPVITGQATSSPVNGWFNRPVDITFTCADVNSGVASCPSTQTLTTNGPAQSLTGTVRDLAGRSSSTTVSGINIDAVPPTVTVGGVTDGAVHTLGTAPSPSCAATDALSGMAGACTGSLTGGNADGTGLFTYTATAKDVAGNVTVVRVAYQVIYRFDGYLSPIGDAGAAPTTTTAAAGSPAKARLFTAGSTIPVRFQLKRADGSAVASPTAPVWLTPVPVGPLSSVPGVPPETVAATSGSSYVFDRSASSYHYNWQTARTQAGAYWLAGVALGDGTRRTVLIGLR